MLALALVEVVLARNNRWREYMMVRVGVVEIELSAVLVAVPRSAVAEAVKYF